jgi:hypothetical protein
MIGEFHDLDDLLSRALRHRTLSLAEGVTIGWAKYSRYYGQFDSVNRHISIAARFDSSRVPQYVMLWLIGHELLHCLIPWVGRDFHPETFRQAERQLPWYGRAQAWLAKHPRF